MAYHITPTPIFIIGNARFNRSSKDWRSLVEVTEWEKETFGADLRWCSGDNYPYVWVEGRVECNISHRTGLLKKKPGTKHQYFYMTDSEEWSIDAITVDNIKENRREGYCIENKQFYAKYFRGYEEPEAPDYSKLFED